MELTQIGLDLAGIPDPSGVADVGSGLISLRRGDWLGVGISVVSLIPGFGDLAKFGKIGKWLKTVTTTVILAGKNAAYAKIIGPILKGISRGLHALPDSILKRLPDGVADKLQTLIKKIDDFLEVAKKPIGFAKGTADNAVRNVGRVRWPMLDGRAIP